MRSPFNTGPWKKVTDYAEMKASTGYSVILTLECGHQVGRKASQGIPKKARCPLCPSLQNERK